MRNPFDIPGPPFRALFVAALLLAAYALFRYWQSLEGTARTLRWLLLCTRALALLLLASALVGVRVEYETSTGARVLLRDTRAASAQAAAETPALSLAGQPADEIAAAFQKRSLKVIEETKVRGALALADEKAYVAGLLLTDGAMSAGEAARFVKGLSAEVGGAPVFVVNGWTHAPGPTVALERVEILGQPVRGVPLKVRCDVHGRYLRGRESLLTIADEARVQASARVRWTGDDERQQLTLEVLPKLAGWASYTARVEAAGDGGDGDLGLLTRPFNVYVEERRWRVLFLEGEPTWEAKFIRRALERSQLFEVDYFAQVSRAAVTGAQAAAVAEKDDEARPPDSDATDSSDDSAPKINPPEAKLHGVLGSAARLGAYDCIIIGPTPNEMLSAQEAARLSDWTERRGGGLVILGGNNFSGSIAAPNGKLYRLMPAAIDARGLSTEAQQPSRGIPLEAEKSAGAQALVPTAAGAGGALGAYLDAAQEKSAKTDVLTGQGMRLGALRPGAMALAVARPGHTIEPSDGGAPLIAAARYGAGRTLAFAPADSWRLRTAASGEQDDAGAPFSALWQGLILWAAAGASPPVEITLSDESPASASALTAEIRTRDATFAPAKIEKLNARLQLLTEDEEEAAGEPARPREIAFSPDEADASLWRASIRAPAPSRYALTVDYVANGKAGTSVKYFGVVAESGAETGAAQDTLSRAARETGGELLQAEDLNSLAGRLAAASFHERTRRIFELRAWPPLAFIIPLLLSIAWLIEKQAGSRNEEG